MRKTALAASGFALVIALSGCGSDGDNGGALGGNSGGDASSNFFSDPQQLAAAASEKTTEAKSSKFSMDMNMAGMQMTATGEASYEGADTKMSMNMDAMGQTIEMRLVDKAIYMKMPGMEAQTGGKQWAKLPTDGNDPMSKQLGSSMEQSDPTKMLDFIKDAGEITNSEQTNLEGQEVTHYTIDLDFKKIAGEMGTTSDIPQEQLDQLPEKLPMELWLNSDQLPVQVVMDMGKIMESAGAGGQEAKMTMKYTDWGTDVNVEAPPADQVGEMPVG
ncbi:DUF6612 family protein [Prauserella cavernicola]|uniref:LppX_LprAFG lipoprotein n=1 Tax=Prauserella cavernicola TaxID=2800127 RepID=A0A934QSW8_9PSEU|nr:DUF6612 family protein [Prauserella cavernicola]MBK1785732.1 hypothetical protein [Prauserella cavernicola]